MADRLDPNDPLLQKNRRAIGNDDVFAARESAVALTEQETDGETLQIMETSVSPDAKTCLKLSKQPLLPHDCQQIL